GRTRRGLTHLRSEASATSHLRRPPDPAHGTWMATRIVRRPMRVATPVRLFARPAGAFAARLACRALCRLARRGIRLDPACLPVDRLARGLLLAVAVDRIPGGTGTDHGRHQQRGIAAYEMPGHA